MVIKTTLEQATLATTFAEPSRCLDGDYQCSVMKQTFGRRNVHIWDAVSSRALSVILIRLIGGRDNAPRLREGRCEIMLPQKWPEPS